MKSFIYSVVFDCKDVSDVAALPFPYVAEKDKQYVVNIVADSVEDALAYCRKFGAIILCIQQTSECLVTGTITDFE